MSGNDDSILVRRLRILHPMRVEVIEKSPEQSYYQCDLSIGGETYRGAKIAVDLVSYLKSRPAPENLDAMENLIERDLKQDKREFGIPRS